MPAEVDFLEALALAAPDQVALVEGDRRLSFDELDRLANQYAHVLVQAGTHPGDKIAWVGENSVEVVALVHACRKAGAVSVPMNYRLTRDEAAYVIDNSDATAVLFDPEQRFQLDGVQAACPKVRCWLAFRVDPGEAASLPAWAGSLDDRAHLAPATPPELVGDDPSAGTAMIYTSGTTGKPKGTVRHALDPRVAAAFVQMVGWKPGDVYLTTGPLYHSGPLGFMLIVQRLGGSVIVMRKFDAERWLELVDEHQVTTTFSAPTPIRRVLDLPESVRRRYVTSSLARVIGNAAPWPFELKRRYVEAFDDSSLWEVYGSTELGVDTVMRPEDQMRKPGSCGLAAPLVDVRLFDDEGEEVTEPLVPGEVFVRSGATFSGYYKDPAKFEAARHGDFLSVGDIAYRDEDGYFYICDRKSDMIISAGVNIYPAEIEAVLLAHPGVCDAAVFGVPDEEWGEAVHAVIVPRAGADPSDDELIELGRQHLAGYKVPRSYSRLSEISRSPSGKILKRELKAEHLAGRLSPS